jgi:hypothetical protein
MTSCHHAGGLARTAWASGPASGEEAGLGIGAGEPAQGVAVATGERALHASGPGEREGATPGVLLHVGVLRHDVPQRGVEARIGSRSLTPRRDVRDRPRDRSDGCEQQRHVAE